MKILVSLSATPILFHKTHLGSAVRIMSTNTFKLTPAIGTVADDIQNEGKMFYLSMARSKHGKYQTLTTGYIQLVLDGTKMGHNYKIKPIDYWGEDIRKHAKGNYEMEDRLVADRPTIPSLKYIKEVHVLIKTTTVSPGLGPGSPERVYIDSLKDGNKRNLRKLIMIAKKNKIAVYMYNDAKSAQSMDKRKALNLRDADLKATTPSKYWPDYGGSSNALYILELFQARKLSQLSSNLWLDRLAPYRRANFITQFSNAIHNDKSNPDSEINKVIKLMIKHKLRTIEDVYDYLYNRWYEGNDKKEPV